MATLFSTVLSSRLELRKLSLDEVLVFPQSFFLTEMAPLDPDDTNSILQGPLEKKSNRPGSGRIYLDQVMDTKDGF